MRIECVVSNRIVPVTYASDRVGFRLTFGFDSRHIEHVSHNLPILAVFVCEARPVVFRFLIHVATFLHGH
jgi:hypothetical protein